MTNDTYISGLCRINKHAEQLSILRGIDRRGSTLAEKHLVALFRIWRKAAEAVCSLLNYNKPPNTVNNQNPITGSAASGDTALKNMTEGDTLPKWEGQLTIWENICDLVNWDQGYFDRSTCTCLHGSCVLSMSWWVAIRPLSGPPAGLEQLTDSTSEQL